MNDKNNSAYRKRYFKIIPPVVVLALLMLCFNMLADGLRDAIDPKMKDV